MLSKFIIILAVLAFIGVVFQVNIFFMFLISMCVYAIAIFFVVFRVIPMVVRGWISLFKRIYRWAVSKDEQTAIL
jgi:hypothetical protein